MSRKVIEVGQHFAMVGGTGSGKTTLAKAILGKIVEVTGLNVSVYIIDSKISGDFKQFYKSGVGKLYQGNDLPPLHEPEKFGAFQVWQPLEDDKDLYDAYLKQIYEARQPAIVFIDELSSITGTQGHPPRYYEILLKQGRALQQSVISCTQSSTYIPPSLLRQAAHVFQMRINNEKDKKKLEEVLGKTKDIAHDHGFYYRNILKPMQTNPAEYYKDLKSFLQ